MIAGPPDRVQRIATRPASVTRAMARLSASGGVTRPARLPVTTGSTALAGLTGLASSPRPGAVA